MERSVDFNGRCSYHGLNGLKCAIGCLMPNDKLPNYLEGLSIASLDKNFLYKIGIDIKNDQQMLLLSTLQQLHDKRSIPCWEEILNSIATFFDLKIE